MIEDDKSNKIKICRQCHKIYKSFAQQYCGEGCEKKPPHFKDGHINTAIESREVILTPNSEKKIKWLCLNCHHEFEFEDVKGKDWKCPECHTENDVYPFTSKACKNCKSSDGKYRKLPLIAKGCELCGKADFVINEFQIISELKKSPKDSKETENKKNETETDSGWLDNSDLQLEDTKKRDPQTNLPSITFTILNNNCEYMLYGEGKRITVANILHDAHGFMPEAYYEYLLEKYPDFLFEIEYRDEKFYLHSNMDIKFTIINSQFKPTKDYRKWDQEADNPLPDSQLLNFIGDKLKFRIWVY
jgi:Zn finger protein HypA/HybF involved in hydrogenase expression